MEQLEKKRKWVLAIGIILLLVSIAIGISLGGASMNPIESIKSLFFNGSETENIIIWKVRLPRVVLAIFAGGGLSVVGAVFQGIFKNPMADPFVLGISSGAALGASISIAFGLNITILGFASTGLLAFLGGMLSIGIIYLIASWKKGSDNNTILLTGISLNFFFSSIIYMLMFIKYDKMKEIVMWSFGTFSTASWDRIVFLAPIVIVGSLILVIYSKELNALILGEKEAHSFGINTKRVRNTCILTGTVMIAVIVSICGVIGFVGLMVPHLLRLVIGADYRKLIPFSILYGGIFMVLGDTIARVTIKPSELPIGSITALFGAPFFIFLLLRRKKDY